MDRIDIRKRSDEGDSLRVSPMNFFFCCDDPDRVKFHSGIRSALDELCGLWVL